LADAWIARTQSAATVTWITQLGTPEPDFASAVASAGRGSALVGGGTKGDLAPGGGGFYDAWVARYETCYADCNGDGSLTIADFGCFQAEFAQGHPFADCNDSGSMTIADFGCFQAKYVQGCP
jgi:hypothetical protein